MDGRKSITIPMNPDRGTIKVHENFYVVSATNPNAPGVRLSEAMLSRFQLQVELTTDYALAKKLGVPIFNPLVIFVNQKTGSFTVAEKVEEQKYCILAVGVSFEPMPAEALKEYNKFREKENKKKL